MNPIQKAVEAAGGAKALAQKFQISRQAVEKWLDKERIPAERVLEIEAVTGIPRHELRPDLYPQEVA
jgi:DNA-binding transcriptional regulator YdaS (Cro superfamily)